MPKLKESDLFAPVKSWLEEHEYEVYSEVCPELYTWKRADVVALKDGTAAIVELKTSLTLDLVAQGAAWQEKANCIYLAVPMRKRINHQVDRLLERLGLGLLEVSLEWDIWVRETVEPEFRPNAEIDWRRAVTEAHKAGPPGGRAGGGYVTEYKLMIARVRQFVERHPEGVSIDVILQNCPTYYRHPKRSLINALQKIEKSWCDSFEVGGQLFFKPKKKLKGVTLTNGRIKSLRFHRSFQTLWRHLGCDPWFRRGGRYSHGCPSRVQRCARHNYCPRAGAGGRHRFRRQIHVSPLAVGRGRQRTFGD
jgi:hypothetical protein